MIHEEIPMMIEEMQKVFESVIAEKRQNNSE